VAFEMYAETRSEAIGTGEEFIFEVASRDVGKYPKLVDLYSLFWDSPTLDSRRAGEIVHELIDLLENHGKSDANLTRIVVRLLPFFSHAYRRSCVIRCSSD